METRRSFIGKGSAVLLAGAFGAAPWRTAEALELPDGPTAEELDELRRKWSFWLDPPEGYVFRRESRLVKAYEYSDCRAELYLQRNGPEDWHWQRVLKVFPKTIEKPLPAVGIPFYTIEAMLGHELDDESKVLERYLEIAQAKQLARRGYMAITCDTSSRNYVKYDDPRGVDARVQARTAALKLAEDWPMWNLHAHRVFVTRLMLDLLDDDPRVDRTRIGITGHSLGGQTCFYAGCLDPRVKAIMASDFGFRFDQTCWDVLHYFGGKLAAIRADGLENHTLLTLSGAKPFCLLAGYYDDDTSFGDMAKAKGYAKRPADLMLVNHAVGHRPPAWALEAGYNFLDRKLNGKWGNKPWM